MNRVILGRITDTTDQYLKNKIDLAIEDKFDGRQYFDTRNSSLESFLTSMKSVQNVCNSTYWKITSIGAFIEEAEKRMPKIIPNMDELDHYYAEQILDFLPHAILYVKQDFARDQAESRKSEYYIRTVGEVVAHDLGIIIGTTYSSDARAFILSSPFIASSTHMVIDREKFVDDARLRLTKFHTENESLANEINPILDSMANPANKYRKIRFNIT